MISCRNKVEMAEALDEINEVYYPALLLANLVEAKAKDVQGFSKHHQLSASYEELMFVAIKDFTKK